MRSIFQDLFFLLLGEDDGLRDQAQRSQGGGKTTKFVASAGSRLRFSKLQPCICEAAANLNVQLTGTEAGMNAMTFFHHPLYSVASCQPMVSVSLCTV